MPLLTSRKQKKEFRVTFDESMLTVEADGQCQVFPLAWYPQLLNAGAEERNNWTIEGNMIKWAALGIDIVI